MQNDEGINVDTYIPRKCSGTNQLIGAKDHASVQFNIGLIDENGAYTGEFKTVAFAGFLRSIGGSDQALNRLMLAYLETKRKRHSILERCPALVMNMCTWLSSLNKLSVMRTWLPT